MTLQRLCKQNLHVTVMQSNRYFRRSDELPPPWVQVLPDEGNALTTLQASNTFAVLIRPDAYVLATSHDLDLKECLLAMSRFTEKGEL
jgi:hypothetical protein